MLCRWTCLRWLPPLQTIAAPGRINPWPRSLSWWYHQAGAIPALAPCAPPMLPTLRGNSHTRGNIWKFTVEKTEVMHSRGNVFSPCRANSSISAMRPPWYYLLEEIVRLGVIYGILVWVLQSCGHPWPEPCLLTDNQNSLVLKRGHLLNH